MCNNKEPTTWLLYELVLIRCDLLIVLFRFSPHSKWLLSYISLIRRIKIIVRTILVDLNLLFGRARADHTNTQRPTSEAESAVPDRSCPNAGVGM